MSLNINHSLVFFPQIHFTCSLTHAVLELRSLTCSLTQSLTNPPTHPPTHSLNAPARREFPLAWDLRRNYSKRMPLTPDSDPSHSP